MKPLYRYLQVYLGICIQVYSVCLLLVYALPAQPPLAWDVGFGGEHYEELNALVPLPNGFVCGASSRSNSLAGNPNDFSWNFYITCFDLSGNLLWQKNYGGDQDERLWCLIPTADGGFLAGGHSYSGISGVKTQASRGDMDVWIVKMDAWGNIQWERSFGGLFRDELFDALEMPDGGFLLGCHSQSEPGPNSDKSEPGRGSQDFWIIRTDASGNKIWDKTIGGNGYEQINDLLFCADGQVLLSGGTLSDAGSGDLGNAPAHGGMDFLLMKFDPQTQSIGWTKRYGGSGEDYPYALIETLSGNILMGGRSGSAASGSSLPGAKTAAYFGGDSDYWLIEIDPDGNALQECSLGGSRLDDLYLLLQSPCGQILAGGVSDSDISGNKSTALRGGYDFWLIGMDENLVPQWQKSVGSGGNDALTSGVFLPGGSLLIGGHSDGNAGFEKSQNNIGLNDCWIVSTFCDLSVQIENPDNYDPCSGLPILLNASHGPCPACRYSWSAGGAMDGNILLPAGTQDSVALLICDDNGCYATDTSWVFSSIPPVLSLSPLDTLVQAGNGVRLESTVEDQQPVGYMWLGGQQTPELFVNEAGVYSLTVTNADGCTDSEQAQVRVQEALHVYVPNIFSPNDDGVNEFAAIYGDENIVQVRFFQIYDRWGDLVFQRNGFVPSQENMGWNGDFRGKPAPMGVYTWFAEIEFTEQRRLLIKGNITLLR